MIPAPNKRTWFKQFSIYETSTKHNRKDIAETLRNFKDISGKLNLPDNWDKRNLNTDASGGEKKKNELIQMSMLNTPKLAMLDEPRQRIRC